MLQRFEEVLPLANPQDIANTFWAVATMQQQVLQQLLQAMLLRFEEVLPIANTQAVSNLLWAVATLKLQLAPQQLQQMLQCFQVVLPQANPQSLANTIWAVATMQQQVPKQVLQAMLQRFEQVLPLANPQAASNLLWAVATLKLQLAPQQLQQMLQRFQEVLSQATPQNVSSTLWACGKLQYAPLQLLSALEQQPQQLRAALTAANSQGLANMAWACGQLGYRGKLLPGALLQQAAMQLRRSIGDYVIQSLCNLCWSAAVLDLQQCVPQVLQLAAASSLMWDTARSEELQQLYQVHLWLLDSQLPAPGQCLSGVLSLQQLEQCRDSWVQQLPANTQQQVSNVQQAVLAAMRQLPSALWQQPLEAEQATADGLFSVDIAAILTSGVRVAMEVEGPTHFVQPCSQLNGPTQSRNRALAARGYVVISPGAVLGVGCTVGC